MSRCPPGCKGIAIGDGEWSGCVCSGDDCDCPHHGCVDSYADNTEFDGTGAAHPAWWRGQEDGVWGTCRVIEKVLDGEDCGMCREPLQSVVERVRALAAREIVALRAELRVCGAALEYAMDLLTEVTEPPSRLNRIVDALAQPLTAKLLEHL